MGSFIITFRFLCGFVILNQPAMARFSVWLPQRRDCENQGGCEFHRSSGFRAISIETCALMPYTIRVSLRKQLHGLQTQEER